MKLSEQLQQDSDSGDFGRALEGYAERARSIEDALEMCADFWDGWQVGGTGDRRGCQVICAEAAREAIKNNT